MADFGHRTGDRLERAVTTALADSALTIETLFARIAGAEPALTARGVPWFEAQLARTRAVQILPDGRYAAAAHTDVEIETPTVERSPRPPAPRTVADRFVVFDFEANADRSDVAEHEIIEIGACLVEAGAIVAEYRAQPHLPRRDRRTQPRSARQSERLAR